MTEYAPDAIKAIFDTVKKSIPAAQFGGIQGDKAHTYGYHRGRAFVSSGDYSAQKPDDKQGDGQACSALDITLPADKMKLLTQRLITATEKKDDRVWCLREFFGTTNGTKVTGKDVRDNRWVSSDSSHLWHIHLSVYRKYCNDKARLQQVAQVLIGTPAGGADLDAKETEEMIANALRAYHQGGAYGRFTPEKYPNIIKNKDNGVGDRLVRLEKK